MISSTMDPVKLVLICNISISVLQQNFIKIKLIYSILGKVPPGKLLPRKFSPIKLPPSVFHPGKLPHRTILQVNIINHVINPKAL